MRALLRATFGDACNLSDMFGIAGTFGMFIQSLTSKAFVRCYEPRLVTQTVFLTCLVLLAGLARLEFGTFGMFVGLVGMVAFAFAFASCCMQHLHLQMH